MKTRYKNVTVNPDRHGKLRARFRKTGFASVYMKTLPDQPGFDAEYKALLAGAPQNEARHAPGSVNDLITRYYRCADFAAKGTLETRARRRGIIESFREEFGKDRVTDFRFDHIEAILMHRTEKRVLANGRTVGGQVAAVNLRKQLMRVFAYAKKLGWIDSNPVAEAEKVGKDRIEGFYTWTEEDIATYQAGHQGPPSLGNHSVDRSAAQRCAPVRPEAHRQWPDPVPRRKDQGRSGHADRRRPPPRDRRHAQRGH